MNETEAQPQQPDWSADDLVWLDKQVNPALRGVALRHGRPLFSMALRVGLIIHCVSTIAQRVQKNPELSQMITLLAQAMNDQSMLAAKGLGVTPEQIQECKTDIETVGTLQSSTPQAQATHDGKRVSPGGIILDG